MSLRGTLMEKKNLHTSKKSNFIDLGMPNFSQKPPLFEKFSFFSLFLTSQRPVLLYSVTRGVVVVTIFPLKIQFMLSLITCHISLNRRGANRPVSFPGCQ